MKFYGYTMYMFFLIFFLNFNSILFLWILMEVNMVMFIFIMNYGISKYDSQVMLNVSLFYFILQTLGSVILLMSSFYYCSDYPTYLEVPFILSLMYKIGLFPFHWWFYKVGLSLMSLPFSLLITFQKIPLFFVLFHLDHPMLQLILLFNLMVGSLLILNSFTFKEILISSSIYSTIWFMVFFHSSWIMFSIFFIYYSSFIFFSCKMSSLNEHCLTMSKFTLSNLLFFLMGLPPFSMFFFKFFSIDIVVSSLGLVSLFIIWLFSFLALIFYFNKFYFFLMDLKNITVYPTTKYLVTFIPVLMIFGSLPLLF